MVPIDITLRLIKAEILASRAQKVLLEGFPRLESAGIPGVPDQVAALEREIAQPVHLLHLDNSKYESEGHADATRFRLETLPVIRYFEKSGNCTALDMANPDETKIEGGSSRLAAAVSVLSQQFDPEARARPTAQKLA